MFPKRQRLHTTNDILTVFRRGEVIRNGPIRIHSIATGELKITVIVDKKVSKLATERNRVKRQIRAILNTITLPQSFVVVRGYSGVETLSYTELKNSLSQAFKKLSPQK